MSVNPAASSKPEQTTEIHSARFLHPDRTGNDEASRTHGLDHRLNNQGIKNRGLNPHEVQE